MKRGLLLLAGILAVLVGLGGLLTSRTLGQETDIVVTGADEVKKFAVPAALPSDLTGRLAGVAPRLVLNGANHIRYIPVTATLPPQLQTLLGQVGPRVVVLAANQTRQTPLVYPRALFNDTTPPQIRNIVVVVPPDNPTSAVDTWTTDEFATSVVRYGTRSGVYPWVVSDPLYYRQHRVVLTGLTQGTVYYYRVESTDRSGNTAASAEYTFVQRSLSRLYLPFITRR